MKIKKTSWMNFMAAPIIVASFGMAGHVNAEECPDNDNNGVVNIQDLLNVIEGWGQECEVVDDNPPTPMSWTLTVHSDFDPLGNASRQGNNGRDWTIWDNNIDLDTCAERDCKTWSGGGENCTACQEYCFNMSLETLYKGPSNDSDVLTISFTCDLSNATMHHDTWWPNYALYLTGYHNPATAPIPLNYSTHNGFWYYADACSNPEVSGGNQGGNCIDDHLPNAPSGCTIAEIDLLETGCAQVNGQDVPDSRVNVMQVTTHAMTNDCGAKGCFISLNDKNLNASDGMRADFGSDMTYLTWDGKNHLNLNLDETIDFKYVITKAKIDISITQDGITRDLEFTGADGNGIKDWDRFETFAVITAVNNQYSAANNYGMTNSSSESANFGHAKFTNLSMTLNGQNVQPVAIPNGNDPGFHGNPSDCSLKGKTCPEF